MDKTFLPELRTWIYPPYPFYSSSSCATVTQQNATARTGSNEHACNSNANSNSSVNHALTSPCTSATSQKSSQGDKSKTSVREICRSASTLSSTAATHIEIKPEMDLMFKSEFFAGIDNPPEDEFMAFLNSRDEKSYMDDGDIDMRDEHNMSFNLDSDSDSDSSVGIIDIDQAYEQYSGGPSNVAVLEEDEYVVDSNECEDSATAGRQNKNSKVQVATSGICEQGQETDEMKSAKVSSRGRKLKRKRPTEIVQTSKNMIAQDLGPVKIKLEKKKIRTRKSELDDELIKNLEMNEADFSNFVKDQGFLSKSSKLQSLYDFGTSEPKGAPKFATKISDSYYTQSNALCIYRNILKSTHAHGITITNATDQAFYQPDNCVNSVPKSDRLQKLDPNENIVSVDVYHASTVLNSTLLTELKTAKLPTVALTIEILASQTLGNLRSRLFCENDLICIAEINHPNDARKLDWSLCAGVYDKKTFQSSAIFIHDTIYTTDVIPSYGHILKKWNGQKLLGNDKEIQVGSLNTKIKETGFRPGYPYLYRHNDCEHLLIFTNVRSIHHTDPQIPKLYPRVTFMHNLPPVPCRINPKHLAKFVVKNDPRLPETVVPLCTECCLSFCYTADGRSRDQKTGKFQLYPLIQMSTLPFTPGGK